MRRASWLVIAVLVLGLAAIWSFAAGTDAEQGPVPGASAGPAQVAQMLYVVSVLGTVRMLHLGGE